MAKSAAKRAAAEEARRRSGENLKKQLKRQRIVTASVVGGIVVVAGLFAWAVYTFANAAAEIDSEYAVPDSGELTVPTVVDDRGGILIGTDGVAGGAPATDPQLRVDVYEDALCSVCKQFTLLNHDVLDEIAAEGLIEYYFHPVSILDRSSADAQYPTRAANAMFTVAEYSPQHFSEFVKGLMDNQPAYDTKGLSNPQIGEVARLAGVSEDVIEMFDEGIFTRYVAQATEFASVDGMRGTPTVSFDLTPVEVEWWEPGGLREAVELAIGAAEDAA